MTQIFQMTLNILYEQGREDVIKMNIYHEIIRNNFLNHENIWEQ